MKQELYKTSEVMKFLKISRTTLSSYIAIGILHPVKIGPKMIRFLESDLDNLLSGNTNEFNKKKNKK